MWCGLDNVAGVPRTPVLAMARNAGVLWSVLFSLAPTGESLTVRSVQQGRRAAPGPSVEVNHLPARIC